MAQTGCTSTQYTIPDLSGGTITPMHATYVNDKNESITQCTTVRLGGVNGLFS
jgi:hypothetical protein|tara:strand:+ start:1225 stop:1383 length:159 start_codon:yes stop_codon:yes gene_type:complete